MRDGRYDPGTGVGDETRLTLRTVRDPAPPAAARQWSGGVFLADIGDFEEMNAAYGAAFPIHRRPEPRAGGRAAGGIGSR
jgi:hypothetical protein